MAHSQKQTFIEVSSPVKTHHDSTVFYHTKQNGEIMFKQMLFPRLSHKRQSEHGACTCHIIPVMKKGVPKEPLRKTTICGTIVVMKDYYTGEQWEAFELFISAFLLAAAWKTLEDALWALRRAVGCLAPMASREKAGINDRRQALEMKKCNCTRITAASFLVDFGCSTEASLFGFLPWKWQ